MHYFVMRADGGVGYVLVLELDGVGDLAGNVVFSDVVRSWF